jgi:tetratricopeptide (TPR) repeat protein
MGERALKGFSHPVRSWRVQGTKTVGGRFEALRPELTEFVGRQIESLQIEALWRNVKKGHGYVVEVSGEAGIGKSRLINHAQHTLCDQSQIAKYSCSPYHTGTALHPAIEQITRMMRFRPEQSSDDRLAVLRQTMAQMGAGFEQHFRWIATLLSLPVDGMTPATAQDARQKTFEAMLWWLTAVASKQPTLIIVEDAHWIDPTSLQLAQMIVKQIASMQALLIISFRSPYVSPWTGKPPVLTMALDRLDPVNANAIVTNVAGDRNFSPALVGQIVEKAEGIPLFVEELTRMLLDADAEDEHSSTARLTAHTQLPSTLLDLLTARLDQLAPAKRVGQIAAVIGREFSYDMLFDIAGLPDDTLEQSLRSLVEAGLILSLADDTQPRFSFKHALMRDAAYESILKRDRRDLHAALASALEARNAKGAQFEPELLAQHYTEAGMTDAALKYWGIAALRSLQTSANAEALAHASRGLALIDALPDTIDRRRQEFELRVTAGWAYCSVKDFPADEVEHSFERAQALAAELGDDAMLNYALRGTFACRFSRGELRASCKLAEQEIALAQKRKDNGDLMLGRWALGAALFWMGEFGPARQQLEASLAIYDPAVIQTKIFSSQIEPNVNTNNYICWTLWILGFPDKAIEHGRQAVLDARASGHALSLSMALFWDGIVKMYRGELQAANANGRELLSVTTRYGIAYFAVCGVILDGAIMVAAGDAKSGVQRIQQAHVELRTMRGGLGVPWVAALTAEGALRSGSIKEAFGAIAMGLAVTQVEGECAWEAELYRIKAETLLASGADPCQAEALFRQAIKIAKRQGALSLELRAAMPLVRLLTARGEQAQAYDCVAGIYSRFSEGFDSADLTAAKAMLTSLEGGLLRQSAE